MQLFKTYAGLDSYGLIHLIDHLVEIGRLDRACKMLCDPRFIEAHYCMETIYDLIRSYDAVLKFLAPGENRAAPSGRAGGLLEDYVENLMAYTEGRSQFLPFPVALIPPPLEPSPH